MVLEARQLSHKLKVGSSPSLYFSNKNKKYNIVEALDLFGYDEAVQEVYGCPYHDWKERHQTKATDDQM